MRLGIPTLALVVALPVFATKIWDVNIINGSFSPAIIEAEIGDIVRWPNDDGPDHAFVETIPGYRSCTPKAGGFNSGIKTAGQSFQYTFQTAGIVNYMDGFSTNCTRLNTTGTIYVGPQPENVPTTTTTAYNGDATITVSSTSADVELPTETESLNPPETTEPSSASVISTQGSFILASVVFISTLLI